MIETMSKNFFMSLANNKSLNKAAQKWGLNFGAAKVVAGSTIDSAIKAVRDLNNKGIVATLDHLGEFVYTKEEALEATDYCIKTLEAIAEAGVKTGLSIKITQLGLDIDREFCINNIKNILDTAKQHGLFVRIDMEDFSHCQDTIDLTKMFHETYDNVGTVIQSYLHRSLQDVQGLKGIPLRIVKGAYKESPQVAYQEKKDIDDNYLKLVKKHLLNGSYTAIASHDHVLIEKVKQFIKENNIPKDRFEFQMLYGFRKPMWESLVNEGYKMRIYIPFGNDWFGYYMRRLAERPQNVSFAFKGFFSK
ncbi:proline dehydrogenase family protein [Terrilactibacillus laevilacticus]|uniref:proline dehydrogenase family protein n=1 Tax=Terrilactibacillus laevilacticus TaxID=1380157 RepID=UPI0011464186|nr:proline dehydrogenase family protein [Terrilactibacillus laevilacticus]